MLRQNLSFEKYVIAELAICIVWDCRSRKVVRCASGERMAVKGLCGSKFIPSGMRVIFALKLVFSEINNKKPDERGCPFHLVLRG